MSGFDLLTVAYVLFAVFGSLFWVMAHRRSFASRVDIDATSLYVVQLLGFAAYLTAAQLLQSGFSLLTLVLLVAMALAMFGGTAMLNYLGGWSVRLFGLTPGVRSPRSDG